MALNSKRGPDPCTPALQFSLEAASVASVLGGGTMARVREGPRALEVLGEKGEMKPPPPERMSAFALDQPGSWRSAGTRVHAVSSETERRRSDNASRRRLALGLRGWGPGEVLGPLFLRHRSPHCWGQTFPRVPVTVVQIDAVRPASRVKPTRTGELPEGAPGLKAEPETRPRSLPSPSVGVFGSHQSQCDC